MKSGDCRTERPALGVLGSGRGSNFQALADAVREGRLAARIACVISDVPDAMILERARQD